MGQVEKDGNRLVYRQDDGEITAWFDSFEEKQVLSHAGNPTYKKVFYILVTAGFAYLAYVLF